MLVINNLHANIEGKEILKGINLTVRPGEVHVLLGENGAGKSTLMKVLSGVYTPDEGTIRLGGKEYKRLTPHLSAEGGISIIYQELSVINELSILENLFVGKLPTRRVGGIRVVDYKGMTDRAREVLEKSDARVAKEAKTLEAIRAGGSIFDIYGYAAVLERQGCVEEAL